MNLFSKKQNDDIQERNNVRQGTVPLMIERNTVRQGTVPLMGKRNTVRQGTDIRYILGST